MTLAFPRGVRSSLRLAAIVLVSSGHIGSPDAWYDGPAGPYTVLVHVQAPAVVPGIAIVNVRATEPGIGRVTAFVNRYDATGGTPPPDVAQPVADSPGWFRTRLWVMTPGSNSVTVAVAGTKGNGSVVVPLTAVAGKRLTFDAPLASLLIAVGVVLALGLVTLAGAAVRESVLPPGGEPDSARRRRARFAMARVALLLVFVVLGTGAWWRAEDRAFERNLFRPMAISARIEKAPDSGRRDSLAPGSPVPGSPVPGSPVPVPGDSRAPSGHPPIPGSRLVLAITDSSWTHRHDVRWLRERGLTQRTDLIEDHGKLVHLFMVSTDGRSAFAHLHPTTGDSVRFESAFPPVPPGTYNLFADVVHASGLTQTMTTSLVVSADSRSRGNGWAADPDDSWAVGPSPTAPTHATLADGTTLRWLRGESPIVENTEAELRFAVTPPAGDTASLEPYLGMVGHAVVVREDAKVFIHLHPLGTISVAAQARLARTDADSTASHAGHVPSVQRDTVYFPYAFPQPGNYTIWVQLKRAGRVLTGSFPVNVAAAPR